MWAQKFFMNRLRSRYKIDGDQLFHHVSSSTIAKLAKPASFSFIFGLFQTNINTILHRINVKNVHPVYGTWIRTHDLQNVSLLA